MARGEIFGAKIIEKLKEMIVALEGSSRKSY